MNVVTLSRWQFGITTVYHFFMVPLTIGLGLTRPRPRCASSSVRARWRRSVSVVSGMVGGYAAAHEQPPPDSW